ncbi:inositol monophosphatase family protein [Vagococcus sp.]|uniref:inositol monophosphatase family protein n=1 Tax=Vagococcus sp. TaxID=1933889 RepID=UPI003F98CD24
MTTTQLVSEVKTWIYEASDQIKLSLNEVIDVKTKSNHRDLVTNIDQATERFLVEKIKKAYPEDHIVGEEGMSEKPTTTKGRVWVIDPIDGTMNFVLQQKNFCIMIGIFENGHPVLGFIYDVMADCFIYGGVETGVYLNGSPLPKVKDVALKDGLLGANGSMYAHDTLGTQQAGLEAMGVRILGCAGLDFISVIQGDQCGYISNLAPWDFAAGVALSEPLGLVCTYLDGSPYHILDDRRYFIVATKQAHADYMSILRKN